VSKNVEEETNESKPDEEVKESVDTDSE